MSPVLLALPEYTELERLVLLVVNTGAWTADALAKVRAPGLQTLALFCWYKSTRWRAALADLPLRDIDTLLAMDPFRGLQRVFVSVYCRCDGSSDTDSEEEYEAEDEEGAVPSTGDAGDISAEDTLELEDRHTYIVGISGVTPGCDEAMVDGPSGEDNVWFEQQVPKSMPICSARGILQVRTQVCIYKEAKFLRRPRIPHDAARSLETRASLHKPRHGGSLWGIVLCTTPRRGSVDLCVCPWI